MCSALKPLTLYRRHTVKRMHQPVSKQHTYYLIIPGILTILENTSAFLPLVLFSIQNLVKRSPSSESDSEGTPEMEPGFLAMIQKPYHDPIYGIGGKHSYCYSSYWSAAFIGHI